MKGTDGVKAFSSSAVGSWEPLEVSLVEDGTSADVFLSGERKQTIRGWGGCFNEAGWDAMAALEEGERTSVMRLLFGRRGPGCRFTLCRVPIGASDYASDWYSHNEIDGDYAMAKFSIERDRRSLLPYIQSARRLEPELDLFASPWCPPIWMKEPKVYNSGTLRWEPEVLRAYALYLARFVEAYREEGVRVAQVHIQNEPAADQKFPSCLWTADKMAQFIGNYLGPLFAERMVESEIWLGTLNDGVEHGYLAETIGRASYGNWLLPALSDEKAMQYIAGVGFQWDGKGLVPRFHKTWPKMRLMQTENECGDGKNSWNHALYVFDLLWHYLNHGAEAYIYWNMVLPPGGRSTWGWHQNSLITVDQAKGLVTLNPEFYVIKHFSHLVPPGSRRLELTGPWSALALGFSTPSDEEVIVVANPLRKESRLVVHLDGRKFAVSLPPQSVQSLQILPSMRNPNYSK